MQHKQRSVSDPTALWCSTGRLDTGGGDFVLGFGSGSSGGEWLVKEDERRLVEDGAVMDVDRSEDDITSYWNLSENSRRGD
jgi:hypothetical protein